MPESCNPIILDAYRHDELSPFERTACLSHLESCTACRQELARAQALGALCEAGRHQAPPELGAQILAAAAKQRRPGILMRAAAMLLGALLAGLTCWGADRALGQGSVPADLSLRSQDLPSMHRDGLRRQGQQLSLRPEHLILATIGQEEGR